MDSSCLASTSVNFISKNEDSRKTRKTNHRPSQPMAMAQKEQHVDERDAALGLNPRSRAVCQQEADFESTSITGYPGISLY